MKTVTDSKGNKYQEVSGTCYRPTTPEAVINVIERYMHNNKSIRLYYGDRETGKCWNEENDVRGKVGRSTGSFKIPLLVHPLAYGGPSMLDDRILKIVDVKTGNVLYQHENFVPPVVDIVPGDMPEYKYNVNIDGELYGRCKTERQAKLLRTKMA